MSKANGHREIIRKRFAALMSCTNPTWGCTQLTIRLDYALDNKDTLII